MALIYMMSICWMHPHYYNVTVLNVDLSLVLYTLIVGRALPDEAKAAKIMLKDFVNGRLLFCKLPYDY